MTGFSTLVFDLDGTLIDSAPDIHAAVNTGLAAVSRPPLDLPTVISFIGNGIEHLVELSLRATGGSDPETHHKAHRETLTAYEANGVLRTRLYPGVEAKLTTYRDAGLRLGICTNKPQAAALDVCAQLGLSRFFDAIHGARPEMPRKPDARPLLVCIAELGGTPAETLYVGDSPVDYHTALNAGVGFALFTGGYLNGPLDGPPPLIRFDTWSAAPLDRP